MAEGRLIIRDYDHASWNLIVEAFPDMNFLQLWEYGEARAKVANLEVCRMVFEENGKRIGAAQGLIKEIAGKGAIVINRPLGLIPTEALSAEWVEKRGLCLFVRNKWSSARLDLTPPIEDIRAGLRKNWRGALNKCQKAVSGTDEYGIVTQPLSYHYGTVTNAFLRAYQAIADFKHQLAWYVNGASNIAIARYGHVAEYLAAHTENRHIGMGQYLLWTAVYQAKYDGYRFFDIGGLIGGESSIDYFKMGLNPIPYSSDFEYSAYPDTLINRAIRWRVKKAFDHLSA